MKGLKLMSGLHTSCFIYTTAKEFSQPSFFSNVFLHLCCKWLPRSNSGFQLPALAPHLSWVTADGEGDM